MTPKISANKIWYANESLSGRANPMYIKRVLMSTWNANTPRFVVINIRAWYSATSAPRSPTQSELVRVAYT